MLRTVRSVISGTVFALLGLFFAGAAHGSPFSAARPITIAGSGLIATALRQTG
jgi:hypothetical protein